MIKDGKIATKDIGSTTKLVLIDGSKLTRYVGRTECGVAKIDNIEDCDNIEEIKDIIESFRVNE